MAVTSSTIDTLIEAAVAAVGTGDYTTAKRKVVAAEVALKALPDSTSDGITEHWSRVSNLLKMIDDLENIESAKAASHRLGYVRIGYGRG